MSDSPTLSGELTPPAAAIANGQLATPALSPISEHGETGVPPRSNYEATKEGAGGREPQMTRVSGAGNGAEEGAGGGKESDQRENSTSKSETARPPNGETAKVLKLSPGQIHDLVTSPDSLPVRPATPPPEEIPELNGSGSDEAVFGVADSGGEEAKNHVREEATSSMVPEKSPVRNVPAVNATPGALAADRPGRIARSTSSPQFYRKHSSSKNTKAKPDIPILKIANDEAATPRPTVKPSPNLESLPSPMPTMIPIPPLSLPTYLQLELSSNRPSPLYIHRSATNDIPYESSKVKFERLLNFLLLPPNLEQVLWFGAIACLDAWLYTFTILPLRFLNAIAILTQWWGQNAAKEALDLWSFVYDGVGRVWRRRRQSSVSSSRRPSTTSESSSRHLSAADITADTTTRLNGHIPPSPQVDKKYRRTLSGFRHRRVRSTPSALLPNHKADILQGLLILASCWVLMSFDASRMYHSIRGQSHIKLYVIYNVLEVFDRLLGAIGQDILECLFSKETLERNEDGRSKLTRPFWMFLLALVYNVIHATALFYQVVTLNVAVNSYSNALLTLLMSNQFVEIKGTVFKKFDKENLFQVTCADIVERFHLWLMLLIIVLRNVVEVGGLNISLNSAFTSGLGTPTGGISANTTGVPLTSGFVIPKAFTFFPKWTGEILGPFLVVLGSEALVDWCKHAYINKFNNVKPNVYNRFLDVLAKDYYSHAFVDQSLTKRLGLPVIPLACLFIRAAVQTYHMFLATHMPLPVPSSATGVSVDSGSPAAESTAAMKAMQHIDLVFRRALGRSTFGAGGASSASSSFSLLSIDDLIALTTMLTFFLAVYFILLAFKLLLGMLLLSYARSRYKGMKERERQVTTTEGATRVGGWGTVEIGEEKRRWIYQDDPEGLREVREKEERGRKATRDGKEKGDRLEGVSRYMMVAKRIW